MELHKVIIAPDSFKGVLSAKAVADIIADGVAASFPGCVIEKMPIADGGEGSLETILSSTGGNVYETQVKAPDDRIITASFGVTSGSVAVVEMAQSSGLTKQAGLHPLSSSTYGFGQLISAALDKSARRFVLCIGGSATTDGGCGMAAALGAQFFSSGGDVFIPGGGALRDIAHISTEGLDTRVRESEFTVMCDVNNPLFGPNGAAHVYGPQKGAGPADVALLDDGLRHLGAVMLELFGRDYADVPGAGAAGGLGAGCMAFLGAKLVSGSDAILDVCGFSERLCGADLVITGEGRLDEQSFSGKALSGILKAAGKIPVCSICGVCTYAAAQKSSRSLKVFEASESISPEESMKNPEKYLRLAVSRAMDHYGAADK